MRGSLTHDELKPSARLSVRALIIGAVLLVGLIAVTPYNDYYIRGSYMANHHVPVAASFVLILICLLVNPLLRLSRRVQALSQRELTIVWACMAAGSGLASAGLMRFLIPTLPALRYFATAENRWEETLVPLVPTWLVPTDPDAIRWFYDGAPSGRGVPWGAWAGPIVAWSVLAVLIFGVLLCLGMLVRAQWIDHERMTFPHMQLPLGVTEDPPPGARVNRFFRDGVMWIGFAVPFVLYGFSGLANYIPSMPTISVLYPHFYSHPISFVGRPWSAAGALYLAVLPSIVGFAFLVTTEVSLSVWLFFLLARLQMVVLDALGVELRALQSGFYGQQISAYQDMGAYLALVGTSLYVARGHLRRAWKLALEGSDDVSLSRWYRTALLGGGAGVVLLLAMCSYAGISVPVAAGFFAAYYLVVTGIAWLTSNAGLLIIAVIFRPEDFLYSCLGTRNLRPRDIATLTLPSRAFAFYFNENPLPHYLNTFKLAQETRTPYQVVLPAMAGSVLLGLAVAWVAQLQLVYAKGANALQSMSYLYWSRTPFEMAATYLRQPQGPDPLSFIFMALGAAAFLGVSALRTHFTWWPLHPAGLLLANAATEFWLSFFIAWACKVAIMRYGGPRTYQRARVFFLGMVAGENAVACVWNVVGFITGTGVRLLP